LLPGWWSYKSNVAALYPGGLPPTPALLDDLRGLDAYHRRMEYARQVSQHYAPAILTNVEGGTDWGRTLGGLEAAEKVAPLLSTYPGLKEALVGQDGRDGAEVSGAVEVLVETYR